VEIKDMQSEISKLLSSAINEQKISNAYIFYGPPGSGKEALALEFAKEISSTVSEKFISSDNIFFIIPAKKDFYEKLFKSKSFDSEEYKNWKIFLSNKIHNPLQKKILSDSKNIPVEAIKNLKEKIYFKSKKRKVVLIFNSEALSHGSAESANMLLKILEEPPKNTTFILVTDLIDQVKPTIKSRCQTVYVPRLTSDVISKIFLSNKNFSTEFISFIADNNLNTIDSLILWNEAKVLECIKSYINAIRYKNADSISSFTNSTLDLYISSKNEFNLFFKVIKKFIKLLSMQNESINSRIGFNEFEELALIVGSKYTNMNYVELVKNIEDFHQTLDANANPQLSLMNMIINSNKALN
jgi:DNA polymerase-3 subunit delta'